MINIYVKLEIDGDHENTALRAVVDALRTHAVEVAPKVNSYALLDYTILASEKVWTPFDMPRNKPEDRSGAQRQDRGPDMRGVLFAGEAVKPLPIETLRAFQKLWNDMPDLRMDPPDQPEYLIHSKSEQGYWNNDDGWGAREGATRFAMSELHRLHLPQSTGNDAYWVNA